MSAAVAGEVSSPGVREVELSVSGMTCAACAARVEKVIAVASSIRLRRFGTTGPLREKEAPSCLG